MKTLSGLLIAVVAAGAAHSAVAAEVRVGMSARETYVGLPVTLRIQVANATKTEPPTIPDVDGLVIKPLGTPSKSTQITMINGRTTTNVTQTFAYELTPQRAGTFKIPPITVSADGNSQRTRVIEFVASKSETGDLLFVEIAGKQKEIYVGQALDVTLKIWIRPYSDRRMKITLSEGDMWRLISDRSEWGPFTERLQQLLQTDQRPEGKEVLRKDAEGVEHSYYLYQLDATIYPKRPGTIDADNVKIVANYPTALGRSRGLFSDFFEDMPGGRPSPFGDDDGFSPFGAQLTVQTVRPLVAQAVVDPIKVLPIPTAGRPANYRGAVGQYQIAIDASPTQVKSGDPINLLIGISGTGPMELVQAPPIAELSSLTTDFKVPNEPLAGFVKGEKKVFSTTIRPRKAGVTEIPSIPFSYFDPATAKFETVHSKPVPIKVEQAEMLALDAVEHTGAAAGAASNHDRSGTPTAPQAFLENFSGSDLLAQQTPWALNLPLLLVLLVAPPLFVLILAVMRTGSTLSILRGRFGSAAGRMQRAVAQARAASEIAAAIKSFVARQCSLKGSNLSTENLVGAIRVAGHRNLAIRCEQLLRECGDEAGTLSNGDTQNLETLKQQASQWLQDWQAESLRQLRKPTAWTLKLAGSSGKVSSLTSSTSRVVVAVVAIGLLLASGQIATAQPVELNDSQKQTLLDEANSCYNHALEKVTSDSAEAKQGFADAADKYQLLVGAGIANSRLYFNLANACLESGQTGKAIANYLRCLKLDPTMREAQVNLAHAKKLVQPPADAVGAKSADLSIDALAAIGNGWLNSRIGPRAVVAIMAIAWASIWIPVGLRISGFRVPWKTVMCAAAVMFLLAGASVLLNSRAAERRGGVVVTAAAKAGAAADTIRVGQVVEIVQERSDSIRVRTTSGETVWLSSDAVEAI